ncbi:actin-like ATPase domain-containing protein [Phanerochaete sordida]|uniref:Actin-like ATPase domain-containing protein n=1 Tax=Phanerochaete sordida TaxID=48140 RepID=A0A9P3GEB2_9APHY|nr:actin-like ATPase domain-containing protein [Phanerochaete sordida]
MPRGVPKAKQDESAMKFTSFHVPLPPNPKHVGTTYLKSESQTLWSRNAVKANAAARSRVQAEELGAGPTESRRGSKVIVIHPGSRFLRIGRASDVTPATVPNVIARKHQPPVPPPAFVEGISRPRKDRERGQVSTVVQSGDEYSVGPASDDPFDAKVAAIQVSLRDRMRFYKLRVTTNAAAVASQFNEQFRPETIPEANDPFRVDWIAAPTEDAYLVGDKALRLSDPAELGYVLRWPMYGGNFNTRDYSSNQEVLSDVEAIISATLDEKFSVGAKNYKDHSVVLVIPDFYDRAYVQCMVRMLLVSMGFKQLCVQQESLAATYGAGISNGCVVDMGASTTSIACVDDGLIVPDTRIILNMGGNDITEFLYVLLQKINFPYRDMNLARSYDWNVIEDLKARLCTLAEGDVALNLYDFVVRRPGKPTAKYGLRAYDEIILAPMCLFEPRVIEFEQKRAGMRPFESPDVSDEILEQAADHYTNAMIISTQHLLPSALPTPTVLQELPPAAQATGGNTPAVGEPQPEAAVDAASGAAAGPPEDAMDVTPAAEASEEAKAEQGAPKAEQDPAPSTADAPVEVIDVDEVELDVKPPPPGAPAPGPVAAAHAMSPPAYPGGYTIDVCFEASKLPLDVAIFNSARAAGGDDKIRKYLQAVLVVGGCALVPGMAHALESRLQAIATPLVTNMEKVQIIPPPKDVDPRVLVWKGAAVLGKMDGVADLWITAQDWDILGMRGLKERCFYL